MTLDRMQLSAQTVRDNIAIMEECEEPDDAGYYLQLEHEKFVLSCIEKQIPKKVIQDRAYFCPSCHNLIAEDWLSPAFCKDCGQALDWSDTE